MLDPGDRECTGETEWDVQVRQWKYTGETEWECTSDTEWECAGETEWECISNVQYIGQCRFYIILLTFAGSPRGRKNVISCVTVPDSQDSDSDDGDVGLGNQKAMFTPIKEEVVPLHSEPSKSRKVRSGKSNRKGKGSEQAVVTLQPPDLINDTLHRVKPMKQEVIEEIQVEAAHIPHKDSTRSSSKRSGRSKGSRPQIRLAPLEVDTSTSTNAKLSQISPSTTSTPHHHTSCHRTRPNIPNLNNNNLNLHVSNVGHMVCGSSQKQRPGTLSLAPRHGNSANQHSPIIHQAPAMGQTLYLNTNSLADVHR